MSDPDLGASDALAGVGRGMALVAMASEGLDNRRRLHYGDLREETGEIQQARAG